MAMELVPLCTLELQLARPLNVGQGPSGHRLVYEITGGTVGGDRLKGKLHGSGTSADWAVVNNGVATLDVRATLETEDGALVYVEYRGRTDVSGGPGSTPMIVAPTFETSDERYAWLNSVQAVGKGTIEGPTLTYEWYEAR